MRATYSEEIDEQLRRWAAEGVPSKEQARRLGVSPDRIRGWRNRLGLTPRRQTRTISPEEDRQIRSWIADGWPLKEIAETSGIPLPRIRQDYPEAGMKDPREQGSLAAARLVLHRKKTDKWRVLSSL